MKVLYLNSTKNNSDIIKVTDKLDLFLIANKSFSYELEVDLVNDNSKANVYGLLLGNQSQDFNLKIVSRHKGKNSFSRVHIKAILSNKSKLNFDGLIRIENSGLFSDAYLQNDNLLITNDTIVNSSPQLEILTDDVKASHGVTVKDIDDEYKFYLMARGLSNEQSEGLIIKGFINDIVSNLSKTQLDDLRKNKYDLSGFSQ